MSTYYPVKVDDPGVVLPEDYLEIMSWVSSKIWTYKGFSATIVPWHDKQKSLFPAQRKKFRSIINKMEDLDIDYRTFCTLVFPLRAYGDYKTVFYLLQSNQPAWTWMRSLREFVGSREEMNRISEFLWKFFELQVQFRGKILLEWRNMVTPDPRETVTTLHIKTYHDLYSRILELSAHGVEVDEWLQAKFDKSAQFLRAKDTPTKRQNVSLSMLVNHNGLDPDLTYVKKVSTDPWRVLRDFLGLSYDCDFADGSIPKGWTPSSDDYGSPEDIVKITKEGFYYYSDGSRRRGKYHYMKNTFLAIQCVPENIGLFLKEWQDTSFLTKKPTWNEYEYYACHPGYWDEDGKTLRGRMPSVKWRRG